MQKKHELVVVIVGDGSYLFGVPSSAYWMARKYDTVCCISINLTALFFYNFFKYRLAIFNDYFE